MFGRKTIRSAEWIELTDLTQLNEIDQLSNEKPVVIFKHSTTCGISAGAHHRLDAGWEAISDDVKMYYLDLLRYRPVSNAVANRYDVHHQSPQIIIIKNGKAVYDASHHEVSAKIIGDHL